MQVPQLFFHLGNNFSLIKNVKPDLSLLKPRKVVIIATATV